MAEQKAERGPRGWANRILGFLRNHGLVAPKGLGPAEEFDALLRASRT